VVAYENYIVPFAGRGGDALGWRGGALKKALIRTSRISRARVVKCIGVRSRAQCASSPFRVNALETASFNGLTTGRSYRPAFGS
jgi:hypothetical protein